MWPYDSALWREALACQLGAVETDCTECEKLHLVRQFEHLQEYATQFVEKAAAEAGQRVVVGVAAGGEVVGGDGIVGGAFDAAAGESGGGVAVDQQAEQDFGMVGGAAAPGVGAGETGKVKLLDGFDNETRKMILGEPVVDRGR